MHPPRGRGSASPAGGTSLDGTFAAMLDRWLEVYAPDHWPVSVVRGSLESLRAVGQYGGGNPSLVPRSRYRAHRLERRSLLNTRTGEVELGALYRLEELRDG